MIAKALASNRFKMRTIKNLERYQRLFNESDEAYREVENEMDPYVLAALMWSWMDQLKEPVLRDQEIKFLLEHYQRDGDFFAYDKRDPPKANWSKLDKVGFVF